MAESVRLLQQLFNMNQGQAKRIIILIVGGIALIPLFWLLKTAYEHQGFFAYQYDLVTSEDTASYQEEVVNLSKTDPVAAFSRFQEILNENPFSYNSCHGVAHQMGHATYEIFGFQKAMEVQNALCGAGYIHGVIEARFGLLQEEDILNELPTICDEGNNSCYHGIGHGLMIATDLNIESSLVYCNELPGVGKRNCYDGVWMHIFDLEESGAREVPEQIAERLEEDFLLRSIAQCLHTGDEYKTSCYFYLPRILAHDEQISFQGYVDLCDRVEDKYKVACSAGSGHSNMKYHIADPNTSIDACSQYDSSDMTAGCKEGAIIYYLYSTETSSAEPIDIEEMCNDFTNMAHRSLCKKVIGYRGDL